MADYAGAVAAIQARLATGWATTPIALQNTPFEPPVDPDSGNPAPWVFLEVISTEGELRGAGKPGDHVWRTIGLVYVHVFVPVNSGSALAQQYAVTIGELYRAAEFYSDGAGACVRTLAPRTDGGGSASDDGNWWRVTMTCPFEFLFRG